MIASLHGKLLEKDNISAVVECGGIGFRCMITAVTSAALPPCGNEVFLYTHFAVRDDAFDLFGFTSPEELEVFKLLITVSGIGSKIALTLLSHFTGDRILLMIASGDSKALTAAQGIGKKMAEKIVFELKDKVGALAAESENMQQIAAAGNAATGIGSGEAIEALISLGFSQSDAALAVGRLDPALPADELIKLALKELSRRF